MSNKPAKKELYPAKDVAFVLLGIPVITTIGIFCANFVTSYAGL
jgi:hypothetical protein